MKATLDALDERLRRLLAQPCGRAARIACAALVLLGFVFFNVTLLVHMAVCHIEIYKTKRK